MRYIKRFAELGISDVPLVGGKNASLGEMYRALGAQGVKVPDGFATTAEAYRLYIDHNHLHDRIAAELGQLDTHDVKALANSGARIRQWVKEGEFPVPLAE